MSPPKVGFFRQIGTLLREIAVARTTLMVTVMAFTTIGVFTIVTMHGYTLTVHVDKERHLTLAPPVVPPILAPPTPIAKE